MMTPTTSGSRFPARLAFAAAMIFAAAAITTNATYGWSKGLDLAGSFVWSGVSIAAGFTQLLSWPAMVASSDRRQWGKAFAALCALLICGSYSIVAALGSASSGRTNAASEEKTISDTRKRTQSAYDAATSELAGMEATRPVAELEALVAGARPVCRVVVTTGSRQTVCAPPASLVAELGRAKRRAELEAKADSAGAELTRMYTPKQANSDTHALAGYLSAFGVPVSEDTLNRILVVFAVITIEMGGGLALTLAMSLGDKAGVAQSVQTRAAHSEPLTSTEPAANQDQITDVHTMHRPAQSTRDRLLELVRNANGVLRTGHRGLAEALGVSATRAGQLLRDLVADGAIRVRASKTGSVITLVPKVAA